MIDDHLEYMGYIGKFEYDSKNLIYHGEIQNLKDVLTFQGNTLEQLKIEMQNTIKDYWDFCKDDPGRFADKHECT